MVAAQAPKRGPPLGKSTDQGDTLFCHCRYHLHRLAQALHRTPLARPASKAVTLMVWKLTSLGG